MADDRQLKAASLECLVRIASLYYKHLHDYMDAALRPITILAMQSENEEDQDVVLQAIEFWSTICDEEIDLEQIAEEVREGWGRSPLLAGK